MTSQYQTLRINATAAAAAYVERLGGFGDLQLPYLTRP